MATINNIPETEGVLDSLSKINANFTNLNADKIEADSVDTLTNKTINADNNTISELEVDNIKTTSKTGQDLKVVTGTNGTTQRLTKWDVNGDLVESTILESNVNTLGGTQTITGVKTFSSSPIVPTPTTDFQPATKEYVDNNSNGSLVKTVYATPLIATNGTFDGGVMSSNTEARFSSFSVPYDIVVNTITFAGYRGGATYSTFDIGIYSEDGQTKLVEGTTAEFTTSSTVQTTVTETTLSSGIYYFGIVPNTTGSTSGYGATAYNSDTFDYLNGYDGVDLPKISGSITVTAGTLPSTFDPVTGLTEISATNSPFIPLRLDN
jgi:hypothetical protein